MPYNKQTGQLIINEWATGIGASSAEGFLDMRNCDPFRKPGYLETSFEMLNGADNQLSVVVSVDTSTDIVTSASSILRFNSIYSGNLRAVTFTTTGSLPAPLVAGTVYFVTNNSTNTTFQLSSTLIDAIGGIPIDITTTGTGVHTMTTVNMGAPASIKKVPANIGAIGTLILQDSNNRIWTLYSSTFWVLLTGNTLTNGSGGGIEIWNGYLFAFRNVQVDIMNLNTNVWTNSFHSTAVSGGNVLYHIPFVSTDGSLYFYSDSTLGVVYYIGSVVEETTFDPTDPTTYTWNNEALDIPDLPTCFEDLVGDLVIGTTSNLIYPWDRTSTSYNLPITLLEPYVQCMRSFNNILYFSSGIRGNIYYTYGTTVETFLDLSDEFTQAIQYTSPVISITFNGNELLFFVSGSSQSVSGLYAADFKTRAYHLKYKLSQGYTIAPSLQYNQAIFVLPSTTTNDLVYVGYFLNGIAYVDSTAVGSNFNTTSAYISYAVTPLYEVGTFLQPKTFQHMQLQLARPLTNSGFSTSGGGSIRVSSRKNLFDAFTNPVVFDSATMTATATGFKHLVNVEDCQFVQFKIEIQAANSVQYASSILNTPTIKSIIVT